MSELILINPARSIKARANPRRKGASKMAKRRTAAQRRATAKLIAFNKSRRRRRNPTKTVSVTETINSNPARRRRRRNPTTAVSTLGAVRRRRRRNPAMPMGGAMGLIQSALVGATGAIAVNAATNFMPLPAAMKTGYMKYLTRGAIAVLLGMFGRRFLGANATKMAQGSMTVVLADMMQMVGEGMKLNLGYYSPAVQMSEHVPQVEILPAYTNQAYGSLAENDDSGVGDYDGSMGEYLSEYVS